jgi:hypothetical protein
MSAINALSGSPAASTTSRFSEMSSEDFMKIIFTEQTLTTHTTPAHCWSR